MSELFKDIIPSILQKKDASVVTELNEKDYVPFVVNKALSFHYDCIFWANQMNMLPGLDPLMQFHYYLNTVRGYKRRFQPWLKKESVEDINLIREYYGYSYDKAREALRVLTTDHLDKIRKDLDKGGSKNDKSRAKSGRGDTTNTR